MGGAPICGQVGSVVSSWQRRTVRSDKAPSARLPHCVLLRLTNLLCLRSKTQQSCLCDYLPPMCSTTVPASCAPFMGYVFVRVSKFRQDLLSTRIGKPDRPLISHVNLQLDYFLVNTVCTFNLVLYFYASSISLSLSFRIWKSKLIRFSALLCPHF